MILEPITPEILAIRRLHDAAPAVLETYGADPTRHRHGLVGNCRLSH